MPAAATPVESLLRRERLVIGVGLVAITLLAWAWVFLGAGTGMSTIAMSTWRFPPPVRPAMVLTWTPAYAATMVLMWWVMMIAMMTPSATPLMLLYGRAWRHERARGRLDGTTPPTGALLVGYLAVWAAFSLAATGLQWSLEQVGLLHAMTMWSIEPLLTATLMVVAGLYQLSPIKRRCLAYCRSPAAVIAAHFRPGTAGAFALGTRHGLYCLGCCWSLMALLFAGGIMNLLWIAGLTVFVLMEKLLPNGDRIGQVAGIGMTIAGLWIAWSAIGA